MPPKPIPKRCAIYTRKSSEEGLEQDFNSLQAQREACEAFIKSQKTEGWQLVETPYDDGGFSGGNMDRPGLRQLLADIRANRIDIILVYKIDRLTRSLADFAKMVEVFDASGVSFVAVTQQFNTTTSMGRLTLNILLSFAQFEREVTAERIRDKVAASKKKGMWMGGMAPIGYVAKDKKLVIDPEEAEKIQGIFQRYLELESVRELTADLDLRGIRTRERETRSGRPYGGGPFLRGALYGILTNPVYIGEIRHGKNRYPGLHEPIIEKDLWDQVQARLAERTPIRQRRPFAETSPLAGCIFDSSGERLTPSHASQHDGRRYRYYVSRSLVVGTVEERTNGKVWRVPATEIEDAVARTVRSILGDRQTLSTTLTEAGMAVEDLPGAFAKANGMVGRFVDERDIRPLLKDLVERVVIAEDGLTVTFSLKAILPEGWDPDLAIPTITRRMPMKIRRRGVEMRLVIESDGPMPAKKADPALLKSVAQARAWFHDLVSGRAANIGVIAAREGISDRRIGHLLPLAFLSPDIVETIAYGRQPVGFTAETLVKRVELPLDWNEQKSLLGFC